MKNVRNRSHHLLLTEFLMGLFSLIATDGISGETLGKPYWQDIQVVVVNKEYPRTSFTTYDNRNDALTGKFEKSNYYQSRLRIQATQL